MTKKNPTRFSSFEGINSHLALNNIDTRITTDDANYYEFPFYGFDIFALEGATTTRTYTVHGVPFNTTTFKNEAGIPMVKLRTAMGMDHNHYTEFARDIWNFFECFSRDPETKELTYNAPEQVVGETVFAKCGEGETAVIDITYNGDVDATSLRFQLDTDLAILDVTSNFDIQFNPANGKVIVWDREGIKNGDVLCSIALDLNVNPWLKNDAYSLPIAVIDATDMNNKPFEVGALPATIRIVNECLPGDVNCDGVVSNADLIELARYLVDLVVLDYYALENADMNADGIIGNIDLVKIARLLVA